MKKLSLLLTLILSLSAFSEILAWNRIGHIVISDIACDTLSQTQLNDLDKILSKFIAKLSPDDKRIFNKQPYSSCKLARLSILPDHWKHLTFPQIAKSIGVDDTAIIENIDLKKTYDWHFRNKQYDIGKLDWVVKQLIRNIKKSTDPAAQALGIVFLTHLLEDAHQPLHSISRPVNKKLNLLDNGGNLYCLQAVKPGAKCQYSLHKYWDNGGGFLVNPNNLKTLNKNILMVYPEKSFTKLSNNVVNNFDPNLWLEESSSFETLVYKTPPRKMPSKFYKAKTQKIAQQRMALAAYRLSNLLNEILDN